MDQAADGAAGVSAGAGVADTGGTSTAGTTGQDGASNSGSTAVGSLLASAGAGQDGGSGVDAASGGASAGAATDGFQIPEKFQVKGDSGQVDWAASIAKMSESYANLEKRMGSGDAPPKSPDDYKPELSVDGFDWDTFRADPKMQGFLKSAHAKGLSNAQLSFVLGEYVQRAGELVQGSKALEADNARAELVKVWGDERQLSDNLRFAYQAFDAYASAEDKALIDQIGNNPVAIRLLANIGKQMQEDRPPLGGAVVNDNSIDALLRSTAYTDHRHPEHAQVSEQVRRYFAAKYKDPA